jgi:SAM-dependent methyltransferase
MDFDAIDWNTLWQKEAYRPDENDAISQKERWDKRADKYEKRAHGERDKNDYITQMLDRIEVKSDWSVLDIGSGPGILALPLARRAASVTALDISSEMLKRLQANAVKGNIDNVQCINASWQDAFARGEVAGHDVVVASRSLISRNMKEAVTRIQETARQAVYLTLPVVHLPFDWEVFQAIGRKKRKHPPFVYIYNMLFQMGILADVEILRSRIKVQFSSVDEAIDDLQWRTDPFTDEEQEKMRKYLGKKFKENKGTPPVLTHEGNSVWALITWHPPSQVRLNRCYGG